MLRISFKVTPEQVEPVLKSLREHGIVTVAVKALDEPNPAAEPPLTAQGFVKPRALAEFLEARGVPEPPKQEPIGEMWDRIKTAADVQGFPIIKESKLYPRDSGGRGKANKPYEFGGGKKRKEIDGYTLVLDIFRTLPYGTVLTTEQVNREFIKFDFQSGSAVAYLAMMVSEGKLIRPRMGHYYMPDPQQRSE